jgi:hypothetical protein
MKSTFLLLVIVGFLISGQVFAQTKKIGTIWSISGAKDKDWEFLKGDEKSDEITVEFNKVGMFSVSNTVTFSKSKTLKDGTTEEEEDEISVEKENLISVTNNLDELTNKIQDLTSKVELLESTSQNINYPTNELGFITQQHHRQEHQQQPNPTLPAEN